MTDWPGGHDARIAQRATVSLEVRYRTSGSFLVSYSLNLSKGGLFIETTNLLPVGAKVLVQFGIPGADEVSCIATVIWVRQQATTEGPPGMGVAFESLDDDIGDRIDKIVSSFSGVTVRGVASDAIAVERLGRTLRGVLSCEVINTHNAPDALARVTKDVDLVVLDADALRDEALFVAHGVVAQNGPPVLALARNTKLAEALVSAGVAALLPNPAAFSQFREAVLSLLARPLSAD